MDPTNPNKELYSQGRSTPPLKRPFSEIYPEHLKRRRIATESNKTIHHATSINLPQITSHGTEKTIAPSADDVVTRINKIEKECIGRPLEEYYQAVFAAERSGLVQEARQMTILEIQSVLGSVQGRTWLIQKSFFEEKELYKGVMYLNGDCTYRLLLRRDDFTAFCNQNASVPRLEELRREKIRKIKNECITNPSIKSCLYACEEESRGSLDKALEWDILEAQFILGDTQGKIWWIRRGFLDEVELYKGVLYCNGECSYCNLPTDRDLIDFFNKNSSIPNLETLRREKINKIKNDYIEHPPSARYYKIAFEEESQGLLDRATQWDILEVQSILDGIQGQTWWIREGFSNDTKVYKGIVYSNGTYTYYALLTESDIVDFLYEISSIPDLETLRKGKIEKIHRAKSEYIVHPPSTQYYQVAFEEESRGFLDSVLQHDILEAQSILGGIKGEVWWIRKGFSDEKQIYKGILYRDGECFYCSFLTDSDLVGFLSKNTSIPDLETLRREKIREIKNKYTAYLPSIQYYQTVFEEESKGLFDNAAQRDILEAQSILNWSQGMVWWIRKGLFDEKQIYKGIVYFNGECSYCNLFTEDDLMDFFNKNSSIPDLETLRKEKIDRIKNEYIVHTPPLQYYGVALEEETRGLLDKALQLDISEVQSVLGGIEGQVCWIRKGFSDGEQLYKGIMYLNGECSHCILRTDNDTVNFLHKNSPIPDLEILRRDRIKRNDKIKNEYIVHHPSSRYYKTVFDKERKGSLDKVLRLDVSEAQTILGGIQGQVWWIREGFFDDEQLYKGIVYLNGKCSYCTLRTDGDLVAFLAENTLIPDLETLRRGKISKIKKEYVMPPSRGYYQDVSERESKGLFSEALQITISEIQSVLGDAQGVTWFIRKSFSHDQEIYKGVVYSNGKCAHYVLSADDDLVDFFHRNSSFPYLEELRKRKIEKINELKEEYIVCTPSLQYYQVVLEEECKGSLDKALEWDILEAQSILGGTQGQAWWVRKGFSDGEQLYKGIVYLNGKCSCYSLPTENDLDDFLAKNALIPDLEALRKEKINKIKKEYTLHPSEAYYQDVLVAESKGLLSKALQMTILEIQSVLGGVRGETWFIRKSFSYGQEVYKGVIYVNGKCTHYLLPVDNDLIDFFNQNSLIPDLEEMRRRKARKGLSTEV